MRSTFFALLCLLAACRGDPGRVEVGLPVPAYATKTLAGDSVTLASERGNVILLNVWATWCTPCRTEIPELMAIHEKYESRGLKLIGVTIDGEGSDDAIHEFMNEFGMKFPIWHDPDELVLTTFLSVGVPSTFLIDRDGILRWRKLGQIRPGEAGLEEAIGNTLAIKDSED